MSELNHPEPITPQQARAYALLRHIHDRQRATRSDLVELNGGRDKDTRTCLRFLRDHNHVHVPAYTEDFDPIYAYGMGVSVRPPTSEAGMAARRPKKIKIPPRDPLVAALFGRPAKG